MRLPINTRRTRIPCLIIDGIDQGPPDALAPGGLVSKQILQITDWPGHGGIAMIKVVNEADEVAIELRYQGVNGLIRIEKAIPGQLSNFVRYRFRPDPFVEGVVSLPQTLPLIKV